MKPAQLALILGFALVGGIGGVLLGRHFATPSAPPLPQGTLVLEEGAKRPDAELSRLDGSTAKISDFDGRPLLINFWATWCPPCVKEMPLLDQFHREQASRGWRVLGLAVDSPSPVRSFLARQPVGFAIGMAGMDGVALARSLGNKGGQLPYTVVFDTRGQLRERHLGAVESPQLAGWAQAIS